MPTRARKVEQLAMDERVLEDDDSIIGPLESYQNAKTEASAAAKVAKDQKALAMAALEKIEIPVGGVVRIGRFRISRITTEEAERQFVVPAKDRLQIALADE